MSTATAIKGNQRATTRHVPAGAGDESAVRIAEILGYQLLPWQEEVLTLSACTDRTGMWKSFENVVIAPRQQGKSFLTIPRILAGTLVYGERLVVYSAHEYRTAQETWLMLREACAHPSISPHVKQIKISTGAESVTFHNGSRFLLRSRSKTAGRGYSPDVLILDEAFAVTNDMMAALIPSMAARKNPQILYLSSAGSWQSEVLLSLRKRGHARTANRLAYWEWGATPDEDPRDERVWAKTNPSYGVLSTKESVLKELESMPSVRQFQRERLGVWWESFTETAMSEEDVYACAVDVPPPPRDGRPIGWGVEVLSDRSASAVCAAFRDDDDRPTVVLVESRPGAGWVPQRLGELAETYGGEGFAFDSKGGLVDLMDRAARDYDVVPVPLKYQDYPAACAGFTQAVADRSLHIGRAPELMSDAVNATARPLPNGWVWDRRVTTPPTRLIAATCALYALDHGAGGSSVAVY